MVAHVDDFRTVHNLNSLRDLAEALNRAPQRRAEGVSVWAAEQEETRAHAG